MKLTAAELNVMRLLSRGLLYKEIAAEAGISINTVKKHLLHSYQKLNVKSRKEAVVAFEKQYRAKD